MCFFGRFLNPILAILCVKWAKMAPLGGSRGVQNEFFGPETQPGPNEYRFWTKKFLETIWRKISDPRDLRPKKIFDPGRARGQPKGGQNRSVGVSNPSKTVGHPPKTLYLSINIRM